MMIDAMELIGLRMSSDGKRLRLRVRDQTGQTVSLSVPTCWLNAMLSALPPPSDVNTVHPPGQLEYGSDWKRSGSGPDAAHAGRTGGIVCDETVAGRGHGNDRHLRQFGTPIGKDPPLMSAVVANINRPMTAPCQDRAGPVT